MYARFEAELENLRQQLKIPALSAAIVKDQALVWARGCGYASLENQVVATPDTRYHLASLTKLFAGTILMQLVEEGNLDLEDPVSDYGIQLESAGLIRVKHLLSMTSEGNPGERFQYNGDRFSHLTQVMERASDHPFEDLLEERIFGPLGLADTAPSSQFRGEELARPYKLSDNYEIVRGQYPTHFSAAAGLISTVRDLVRFDIALDQNALLSQETREMMFTPTISTTGAELPYGLAWFIQHYQDIRLIWAYGWWDCISSIFLKVPAENITFIILANTDSLSRPYGLGSGNVLIVNSTVALAFYKTFIFEPRYGQTVPDIDWEAGEAKLLQQLNRDTPKDLKEILRRELYSRRSLYQGVGKWKQASRLMRVAKQLLISARPRQPDPPRGRARRR